MVSKMKAKRVSVAALISCTFAMSSGLLLPFVTSFAASAQTRKEPMLVVTFTPGLVPFGSFTQQSAAHTVFDDGTHYWPDTVVSESRPALHPIRQNRMSETQLDELDRLAIEAQLDQRINYGLPLVADAPSLVVTYRNKTVVIAAWGVGESSLTSAQQKSRTAVGAVLDALGIATTNGKTKAKRVLPKAVVVFAQKLPTTEDQRATKVVKWPTASARLEVVGECSVLTGPSGSAAAKLLVKQDGQTRYKSGGDVYSVYARIFIEGDRGCDPPAKSWQ
jgi:hypothetical protein